VQAVEPPRALGPVADQTGRFQQPEMSGHGRAADRKLVGKLTHRAVAASEQLDDGAAMRIAERVERVSGQGVERDAKSVAELLRSAFRYG
jgi:hypothetical protein